MDGEVLDHPPVPVPVAMWVALELAQAEEEA